MTKISSSLLVLLIGLLSSCVAPPQKLLPGSTVTFVNRVEPSFDLWNPTGILRKCTQVPLPGGSAMMRAIVMEEAARAGVRCIYVEKPYKQELIFGRQEKIEAKALAASAASPVTMVLTPVGLDNNYDASAMGGFVLDHNKNIWGPILHVAFTSSDIRIDTVNGRQQPTELAYGLAKEFQGFAGGHRWESASTASRERAIRLMALLFRTKVAALFGNPEPLPPVEFLQKGTAL